MNSEGAREDVLIGARYRLMGRLGQGGMAVVDEAEDTTTGRRIALKRLRDSDDPRKQRRSVELFEREFHTLAQLAHPRIVEVYDYAVDPTGPYYTMELLDGGDFQQLVPAAWRKACAVARDVCSALSLLHSRRAVHRDLSPRNVRCTSSGLAKLIDFGAMVPMGRNKYVVVGTPAYCAPEVVHLQALDARTDLYALGATLYYTLTGRHAYPAKDFPSLIELWQCAVPRPSQFIAEIPEALDALVMDLLRLDPTGRPANASEVMDRIGAIDGLSLKDTLPVAQAYLSTPNLVGRDHQLTRARMRIMRSLRGHGNALLVSGASGSGRSRFLDACVLEGKLLGSLVLRADADDAQSGEYGAIRALAKQMLDGAPEETFEAARPHLRLLGHAIPELLAQAPDAALESSEGAAALRPKLQPAIREWFLALSKKKPLLVAVDDVHRIDEPSAAAIALLSHDLKQFSIALFTTAERGATATAPTALKLLSNNSTELKLDNLIPEDTQKLLESVFGDVPGVPVLAHRLHGVSSGNPRNVMQLAQHLVDKSVVRYRAGAWSVPESFDAADLPSSMAQALKDRVDALTRPARELARTISMSRGISLTFAECQDLSGETGAGRIMDSLDELLTAEVLRSSGEQFELARSAWAPVLQQGLDEECARELNSRLAALFDKRDNDRFRVGQHLLHAGERTRAVELLAAHAEASQEQTHKNPQAFFTLILSLPFDWLETYEEAIRLCDELGQPKRHKFQLQSRLSGLASVMGIHEGIHMPMLIALLSRASGLKDIGELDAAMDPMARLMTALGKARDRYAGAPEHDRVLDPGESIRHLARAVITACGVITSSLDVPFLRTLPSLSPLAPLSPALGVVQWLTEGMAARQTARMERAQEIYGRLLERTGQPDRAGLDESHHLYMTLGVLNGLGMIEAGMGLPSCLERAKKIESEPTFQVNAVQIRMLYHLWQGDIREAGRQKQQIEILRIQNSPRQWYEGSHLLWQVAAHAATEDLTRLKQTNDELADLGRAYPGWVPVHHYGLGEYHRARGDFAGARREFEKALEHASAGNHQLWPNIAGAHARTLYELGSDSALDVAKKYVEEGERAEFGYVMCYLLMPLSLVLAKRGHAKEAVEVADRAIRCLDGRGVTGLNLGLVYETRARVAVLVNDMDGFEHYERLTNGIFGNANNPALVAKCERLKRDAQRAEMSASAIRVSPLELNDLFTVSRVVSTLEACRGVTERAQAALALLAQASGTSEGVLYLIGDQGAFCAAQLGEHAVPPTVHALVHEYLAAEAKEGDTTTNSGSLGTSSRDDSQWAGIGGEAYRPVLLTHQTASGVLITGVALLVVARGGRFVFPGRVASEISRRAQQAGDVSGMVLTS